MKVYFFANNRHPDLQEVYTESSKYPDESTYVLRMDKNFQRTDLLKHKTVAVSIGLICKEKDCPSLIISDRKSFSFISNSDNFFLQLINSSNKDVFC